MASKGNSIKYQVSRKQTDKKNNISDDLLKLKKRLIMFIRKPKLRITSKGIKVTNVGARIGSRRAGINISRRGVSGSVRGKGWSYNTRRGCTLHSFSCCSVVAMMPLVILVVGILVLLLI